MRHQAPIAVTAVIAALTLASGVSTAAAADESKPTVREVAKLSAPDADTAAAAQRIDEQGSALGSYWDPDRAELVVVVGPDSDIGEAEAEKLVGGRDARRAARHRQEDLRRHPRGDRRAAVQRRGREVQLLELPGPAQRPRRAADGRAGRGHRAAAQGAPRDRAARGQARPRPVPPPRRHPVLLGRRRHPERRRHVLGRVRGAQAVRRALHDHRGALLRRRRDGAHPDQHVLRDRSRSAAR